jgi:hypothetical protein
MDFFNGIMRALVPAATAYAAGKGWMTEGQAAELVTAGVALGSAVWSVASKKKKVQ